MMHKEVEIYIDDMMVRLETREGHFEALDKFLARLEKYNLRLNPKKVHFWDNFKEVVRAYSQ